MARIAQLPGLILKREWGVHRMPSSSLNSEWQVRRSLASRLVGRLKQVTDPVAPRISQPPDLRSAGATNFCSPIFIIGCQRSGTSLLRRIMDSHSNIACPPETNFILPLAMLLEDVKAMAGFDSMGYAKPQVEKTLAQFISSFFEEYASLQGKRRWADKTPQYVDCLPQLGHLFGPSARFIMIIRHGLDVAFSLSDAHRHYRVIDPYVAGAGGKVAVGAGVFWAQQNEKMEEFRASSPDICFRLRYEDLTSHPEPTLRSLFAFLGEPWEPQVMEYWKFPHHAGIEDPEVRRRRQLEPNSHRYQTWPAEVQLAVAQACEPLLSRLGYSIEVSHPA